MTSTFKTKKLIKQQINSGTLSSYFNRSTINTLSVGNGIPLMDLTVDGDQNIIGNLTSNRIGINTTNPTQPFEIINCSIFNGQISISISSLSTPYTSIVIGTKTKFNKIFKKNDLIVFLSPNNTDTYGIITSITNNLSLTITTTIPITIPVTNVNYEGYFINPGIVNLNASIVTGTNTYFTSFYKVGDQFITTISGSIKTLTINVIVSDTILHCEGSFPTLTGLNNYSAVKYDVFDEYGNLGLGTYDPTEKLDVQGNINLSGHIYNNGVLVEKSQWLNSPKPPLPPFPYTQNIYYDLGYVGIGNTSSNPQYLLDVTGSARFGDTIINSTTNSTSTSTGSIVTTGGVGIAKNLYVGGVLNVTGLTTNSGGITVPTGQTVAINGNSTLTVDTGATTLGGVLNVTGLTTNSGGITVPTGQAVAINGDSTLTVGTGATTLGGVLNVTGATTLTGALTANGTTALNDNVTVAAGKTLTVGGILNINITSSPPTSTTTIGTAGTIAWGSDYIYVCVGTNTWKRASLLTW